MGNTSEVIIEQIENIKRQIIEIHNKIQFISENEVEIKRNKITGSSITARKALNKNNEPKKSPNNQTYSNIKKQDHSNDCDKTKKQVINPETPINTLLKNGLSFRAYHALFFCENLNLSKYNGSISKVKDLEKISLSELRTKRNFGKVSEEEILKICELAGIKIRP
jgi:hypothetical protein